MAFAKLFSSPPGEVDFNAITKVHHKSGNGGPKKRKRKNDVSSCDARRGDDSQTKGQYYMVPFKYKEDQADVHQKLSADKDTKPPSTQQSRLGPSYDGCLKNGQMRKCQWLNKKEHFAKNYIHRATVKDVDKRQGQDANRGKGCVLEDRRMTGRRWRTRNTKAESKKGQDKWQTERLRPKQQERKPFMSQEFKEENSIDVNGRLICKHFLREKCLKGDECQFEHSRDLGGFKFNEGCKFYVQGFCLRGDHCLYMHRTFPCKFFHTGRKCYQDNNCKFSHDPLTELTKGLLDKLLEQKVDIGSLESGKQEPESAVDLQNNSTKLSFYSNGLAGEHQSVCRFSFGANNAEFIPEPSACEPALSSTHMPLTAPPLTPLRSRPKQPAISISSALWASEDSVKTEGPKSPTPPGTAPSVLKTLFTHLSPCQPDDDEEDDLEMDVVGSWTETGPLMNGSSVCTEVGKREEGVLHSSEPPPVAEPDFIRDVKKKEDEKACEPVAISLKPVPCSTPITNLHRSYKPLAVDLSPLPPLPCPPYTPYQLQPFPPTTQCFSPIAPSIAYSSSREAVQHCAPHHPRPGICASQIEPQGRHSLPVQLLSWSAPSARAVRQSMLPDRSLNAKQEPQ